jgi:hypothetical protein
MVDPEGLQTMRTMLGADGYTVDADEQGDRLVVRIGATPEACEDCLAPPEVMRAILGRTLKVAPESIDLHLPADVAG